MAATTVTAGPTVFRAKVSIEEADVILRQIPHVKFQEALNKRWRPNGEVPSQCVCWLFCWAKTGLNSRRIAEDARRAFNDVLEPSFEWLDRRLDHDDARILRYKSGDCESEFARLINQ